MEEATKLRAHWHSGTSMGITNSSGIKNSINNRQINQVEKKMMLKEEGKVR